MKNNYQEAQKWIDEMNAHTEWARCDITEPALSQVTELLEKATPKKAILRITKYKPIEGEENVEKLYTCPACGHVLNGLEGNSGCPYCLQAIEWGAKKKNASELFIELGYDCKEYSHENILYQTPDKCHSIHFAIYLKRCYMNKCGIDAKELFAIRQQMEELGWI